MSNPAHVYRVDLDEVDNDWAWSKVDDLAYEVGIGVGDPDADTIIALLCDHHGRAVAGAWRTPDPNKYNFNIAVSDAAQGHGLGRQVLELVLLDFEHQKVQFPKMIADIHVINPQLRDTLYRRGFAVTSEDLSRPKELSVKMTQAHSIIPFLREAMARNGAQCKAALNHAANNVGVPADDVAVAIENWAAQPLGTPAPAVWHDVFREVLIGLPLPENEAHFIWAQLELSKTNPLSFYHREQWLVQQQPQPQPQHQILPEAAGMRLRRGS